MPVARDLPVRHHRAGHPGGQERVGEGGEVVRGHEGVPDRRERVAVRRVVALAHVDRHEPRDRRVARRVRRRGVRGVVRERGEVRRAGQGGRGQEEVAVRVEGELDQRRPGEAREQGRRDEVGPDGGEVAWDAERPVCAEMISKNRRESASMTTPGESGRTLDV